MIPSRILLSLAVLAAAGAALAAAAPAGSGPIQFQRLTLPGGGPEHPFPYTLEVPKGWTARQVPDDPGLWIGPADAKPNQDPRMIYVRISTVSLADPAAIVAAIKANDAKDDTWSAPLVEVREVHGVKGVWVETERGKGAELRRNLTLKMPLPKTSVDFIGQAKGEDFGKWRATYEHILLSVTPAVMPAAPTPAKKN